MNTIAITFSTIALIGLSFLVLKYSWLVCKQIDEINNIGNEQKELDKCLGGVE